MSDARRERSEAARTSALEAMHEEEALGKAYDARLLARLWPYVAPHRGLVLVTLLMVFPVFLLELAPAWIVKTGLDRVIGGAGAAAAEREGALGVQWILEGPEAVPPLAWLTGLYLLAAASGALLQFAKAMLLGWTGWAAMRDLRTEIFAHVQRLNLGFFDRYPVGRLVTRATNDVENVAEMFSAGILLLVTDLLMMMGFAVALFLVDARLAMMTFLVVPLLAVVAAVFRFKVRQAFRLVRVRIARINAYVQENITGMKIVQLFTRERRNLREFDAMNAEHRDAWLQSIRYDSALFAVVELAQNLTIAIIISYGFGIALGTLYVFVDWMRRFFLPLRELAQKYSVMQSSMAGCERIFQLLDTEPGITDGPGAAAADGGEERGAVEFENVSFAYRGGEVVLRDVSFRVRPGEKVAIVGPTGAGKTTIIHLLDRLYEVTEGRVLVDGVDLRGLRQASLRRRVALVSQDVFLFSGTIADNVALGRDDLDRAAVVRACRAVRADRFIEGLPEGYDTEVRERGANFSAGQRQLLSFARALAHGAEILVLDEATSSIDSETEALIQEGLRALMEDKTAIVIAHRLSTIRDVDRIYVLHKGRIVESGGHRELLSRGGAYHRLYRLQYEAQESGAAPG